MNVRLLALLGAALGCASSAVSAADSTSIQTLRLTTRSAALRADPPAQKSGTFALRASLLPQDAAVAASPPVQEGGGFVVLARLAAVASVCYSDTIFRDDFDGDGG